MRGWIAGDVAPMDRVTATEVERVKEATKGRRTPATNSASNPETSPRGVRHAAMTFLAVVLSTATG